MVVKNKHVKNMVDEVVGMEWNVGLIMIRKHIQHIGSVKVRGNNTFDLINEGKQLGVTPGRFTGHPWNLRGCTDLLTACGYTECLRAIEMANIVAHCESKVVRSALDGKIEENDLVDLVWELEQLTSDAHYFSSLR